MYGTSMLDPSLLLLLSPRSATTQHVPSVLQKCLTDGSANKLRYQYAMKHYQQILNSPGGSRLPPVKASKAPSLKSSGREGQRDHDCWEGDLHTKMVFITRGTGICDRSNNHVPFSIVVTPASLIGDLDLAATVWSWRCTALPISGQSDDLGTILKWKSSHQQDSLQVSIGVRGTHGIDFAT